ncbi:MAG: hypothetical protein Q9180_004622 [Flavoplaca navasiana]
MGERTIQSTPEYKGLRAYNYRLIRFVAYALEEKIGRLATEQCDFAVRGEFAPCDGALVIPDGIVLPRGGDAEDLFTLTEKCKGKAVLAGYDAKYFMARNDNGQGSQTLYSTTKDQREHCKVLILATPKEPDFLVVLPYNYVPRNPKDHENESTGIYMPPFRPEWALHPAPAFPAEYGPFIVHITYLGQALKNMKDFLSCKLDPLTSKPIQWVNPYTKAVYREATIGELSNPPILLPKQEAVYNALDQVKTLHRAFRRYSQRFKIELLGVRPLLADLKIIDLQTAAETYVELKDCFCTLVGVQGISTDQATNPLSEALNAF